MSQEHSQLIISQGTAKRRAQLLAMPIPEIGLSVRVTENLENQGVQMIADLVELRRAELLSTFGLGERIANCLVNALSKEGIEFAD